MGLSKAFGTTKALDGVDMEVVEGELFFLLGASGCGKSTLLRCIAGLETPNSGRILFGSRDVTTMPAHQRETAMVFQSYALWPHLTVAENIAFGLEERRVPKAEVKQRVEEVLELVHMPGLGSRSIDQLSGGQQQRVSLARALVVKPRCLLLDEPLSNLDAKLRLEMRHEIRRIVKDHGLTAIYVTHDQEEALAMADRIMILSHGRVSQVGEPRQIYQNPTSPHVAAFIGETNLIPATLRSRDEVETTAGIWRGHISDAAWQPQPGDAVTLSIRPEAWRIAGHGAGNQLHGEIHEQTYLGASIQYTILTPLGLQQVLETNPRVIHRPGTSVVTLSCEVEDTLILKPDQP
jgi:iron(III) transport system ATP-binding protein